MTKRTRVPLFLASVVLGAMWLSGCDSEPTAPDPVVVAPSPGPSPSPSPSPRIAATCSIRGDGIVFGIGPKQPRTLEVLVFDADQTLLPNRVGTWSHAGPIQPAGPDNGRTWEYYAVTSGFAVVKVAVTGTPGCDFRITIVESFAAYVVALAAKN